jgi:2-iminobutanoate/2-iminopropanoate deaminase
MTAQGQSAPVFHPFIGMAGLPFSEAVEAGGFLFLSGQIGTQGDKLVGGGIVAETRQALANIRTVLERHGCSLDRVIKVTVMLADMNEWGAMNREYVAAFGAKLPARSSFGTSGLGLGARVEIECLALK